MRCGFTFVAPADVMTHAKPSQIGAKNRLHNVQAELGLDVCV